MKKTVLISILFMSLIFSAFSQVTINQSDMPNIGDTIRLNVASAITDDYTSTGPVYLWDFSNLTATSQRADTFKNIQNTSIVYYVYFYSANLAGTQPNLASFSVPGVASLSITNVYDFYKKATASYSQLGYGALFNGTPLPIKYNTADVQLKFPLTFGEKDSCDFKDTTKVPGLGFYGEKKHRVNFVDGWGTVITPIDTFPAIRVKSVITAHDSIHLDTIFSVGFAFNSVTTEYKWYADNMGDPVMKVSVATGTGAGTTIEYTNKTRPHNTGIADIATNLTFTGLYPNPLNENTKLYFSLSKAAEMEVDITDMLGRNIKTIANKEYPAGFNSVPLDISGMKLDKGIYFVKISSGNSSKIIKLQVL
jgi:hypothetical protein